MKGVLSMSDTERKRKAIINTVYYGMLILGAVLALRYGLGLFLPIILAFIFASSSMSVKTSTKTGLSDFSTNI